MKNQKNEPIHNLSLVKSNEMISAKYKSSLLENQVMAIALTRIEVNAKDEDAPLEAKLYPGELKRLVSDPVHIYRDLATLAKSITGHTMFLEDGKGNFMSVSVVPTASYIDGVFTIKFNNDLKYHILGLERNYTTLELSVLTNFTKNASFRIYELLKKDLYKSKQNVNNGRVDVEYNISEFRFMIGLANCDDHGIKKEMARMGKHIAWDVLYNKLDKKDKKYEKWYDLSKYVIKPAQVELEEKSNIRFEFEGVRKGHSMDKIVFHLYPNEPLNQVDIIEKTKILEGGRARQLEMPTDVLQYAELYKLYIGHNGLTKEDLNLLLKKSDYDIEKIKKAIKMADDQESIYNYMGWLVRCVEQDYPEPIEVVEGSHEKAVVFNNIRKDLDKIGGNVIAKVWERAKKKDDYIEFINYIEIQGIKEDVFEEIYDAEEKMNAYMAWKRGEVVELLYI